LAPIDQNVRQTKKRKLEDSEDVDKKKTKNNVNEQTVVLNHENTNSIVIGSSFASYKPKKLTLGKEHPHSIIETASLALVETPDISYEIKMSSKIYNDGNLSGPQLESVVYACQSHENFLPNKERRGFFIGDGPGVGKGRIIAGIILENIIHERKKIIWFSASNDLILDAKRDLNDIGIGVANDFSVKLLTEVLNLVIF
jgi:hypothetical protein